MRTAAKHLHSAADDIVESPGGLIPNLRWQFALGEMRGALRDARGLGLVSAVKTYSAILRLERARVDFAHFVNRADRYGNDVAQQAREDNPQLTPGQLGTIASNATAWYGNSAVQRNLLASARKVGYSGREGLHRLPDRDGGLNGGLIGFRRAGETSGGKSPAVDLNTPELGDVKIHFVP